MANKPRDSEPKKGKAEGHLGQKRAQEEKESEEMLRNLGDSHSRESSKREAPKLGDDEAKREKVSGEKLKNM